MNDPYLMELTGGETREERAKRWFYYGMNDKERIQYLMGWVDRLQEQVKKLSPKDGRADS